MIRITGGKYRSRKLATPEVISTKPTMDRVREGVFNALQFELQNADVLDLFSGSGSYGLEALSRGANSSTFVELNNVAFNIIKENIKALGEESRSDLYQIDYEAFLKNTEKKFDIIFADPPYKAFSYNDILNNILNSEVMNYNGIIVLESEDDLSLDETKVKSIKKYKYGLAKVYIIRL